MAVEQRAVDGVSVAMLAALAALTAMLYWPALGGPLLLDDSMVISPLLRAADLGQDWRAFLFSDSGPLGRPLAMASFIANAQLSLDLRTWKATNLAVHLVNGALVYVLFVNLAGLADKPRALGRVLALGGAALWLLHPVHVSTVMYLVQRMTELATLFGLLAMILYIHGRRRLVEQRGGKLAILGALLVCAPAAALCKEIGLLTPFYLLALEVCMFTPARWPRPPWLRGLLAACTVLPLVLAAIYFITHWQTNFAGPYSLRDFGPLERLLSEARVLCTYLGWIVAPRRTALGFYHDDVAIAHWPPTWLTVAAIAVLLGLLVLAWRWRQRAPLVAFGVLLFFIGHALESSIFPLELMFEHRNYLPAIGICLVLATACTQWLDARRATLLLGAFALAYGLVTASMTPTWGNQAALHSTLYAEHPDSRRARASLVEWLLGRDEIETAMRVLGDASDAGAQLHRLRIACLHDEIGALGQGGLSAAADMARPDAMSVEILLWLSKQAMDKACAIDDAALLKTLDAIRDRPLSHNSRYLIYVNIAQLRHARGEHALAAQAAATAARIVPDDPYPLYLGVEIALDAGDRAAARQLLEAARQRARQQTQDFSRMDAGLEAEIKGR